MCIHCESSAIYNVGNDRYVTAVTLVAKLEKGLPRPTHKQSTALAVLWVDLDSRKCNKNAK